MSDYRTSRLLAATAATAGAVAWIVFLRADLILTHYDAKAHLVVARRVIDNITPGWQQIGAVWLPLPHLIQVLPTQVDLFYRTGAFGSLVSIACFGVTAYAAARLVLAITRSTLGAVTSVALLVLNPSLLYVQATPMTEPLLLAVTFLTVLWLYEWVASDADDVPRRLGWVLFAAAWTRYEAWLILASGFAAVVYAMWRRGVPAPSLVRRAWRLGIWPVVAVAIFIVNSRVTVGSWFISGGFYEHDPTYAGQVVKTLISVWWGTHQMSGYVVEVVALIVAATFIVRAVSREPDRQPAAGSGQLAADVVAHQRSEERNVQHPVTSGHILCPLPAAGCELLIPVALFAPAVLPFYAFVSGHPFRIRYMIPLVAACALFAGLSIGRLRARKAQAVLATVLVGSLAIESPLWDGSAPLIVEAQWDVPVSLNRRAVTRCLANEYRDEKILASMASLAHYMQELSHEGFDIADFVNEGNGVIWDTALETGPAQHAGWMLVEEEAEGGDVLAQAIRRDPAFARGMTRICEGGGVALYRRSPVSSLRSSGPSG